MPKLITKIAWAPVFDRRIPFGRKWGEKHFINLGGKVESDESDEITLAREVFQETTTTLWPDTIRFRFAARTVLNPNVDDTILDIRFYDACHEGRIKPAGEIVEIELFNWADRHKTLDLGQLSLAWHKAEGYID